MLKYNAKVVSKLDNGFLVITKEGFLGRLLNTNINVGSDINVDIFSNETIEYLPGFWGIDFIESENYIDLYSYTTIKKVVISEFLGEYSFTFNHNNAVIIHKNYGIMYSEYKNEHFPILFKRGFKDICFKDFKEFIELGIDGNQIEIEYKYIFLNVPHKTNILKIVSCRTL
jgi:hypothetical protein